MNTKLPAAFTAALCLMAVGQAKATVTQTGSLLWSGDLTGLQTGPSITPVVITPIAQLVSAFSFTDSGATFSGNPAPSGGVVRPADNGPSVPGTGLAATTNYLWDVKGGSITMTTPTPESYLGFLTEINPDYGFNAVNVTLYNGTTSLGEITAAQLTGAAGSKHYAWININVANGGTYTSAVFSETTPYKDSDWM
jgi:hypothetical protein